MFVIFVTFVTLVTFVTIFVFVTLVMFAMFGHVLSYLSHFVMFCQDCHMCDSLYIWSRPGCGGYGDCGGLPQRGMAKIHFEIAVEDVEAVEEFLREGWQNFVLK